MQNPQGFSQSYKRHKARDLLKLAQEGRDDEFRRLAAQIEHDPALLFSAEGRLQRWLKDPLQVREKTQRCCGQGNTDLEKDLIFVKKLEKYEDRLHNELEVRSRAIKNWKKLRILLILLQVCGGKFDDEDEDRKKHTVY